MIRGKINLKPLRIRDIEELCRLLKSSSAVMLNDDFGLDMDEAKIRELFELRLRSRYENNLYFLALLGSGKIVGYTSVANIDFVNGCAEISTFVDEQYQGIGFGPVIMDLVIKLCFEELNLVKVCFKIREDNISLPSRTKNRLLRELPAQNMKKYSYYYSEICDKLKVRIVNNE